MYFHHQSRLLATAIILCLMLTACVPSSMIRKDKTQDDPHLEAADTNAQILWWKRFDDPLLTWLIQETLRANPDLKTAEANLRSARAKRKMADASLLPNLSASASTPLEEDNSNSYNANLDAKWEADLFGSNRLSTQASAADVEVSKALLKSLKIFLAAEVASTYVDLRLTQAVREAYLQNLGSRSQAINLSQQKRQNRSLSSMETSQAQLNQGMLQAQLPALDSSIEQFQHALAVLSGMEPRAIKPYLTASRPIPGDAVNLAQTVPGNAIQRRPDLLAAEYRVKAASLRLGQAKANLKPRIELGGSFNLNDLSLDVGSIARTLLTSVSLPLFDGGKLKQNVEIRSAEYDKTLYDYRKTILIALQDMEDVYSSLQAIRRQHPQVTHNLELAQKVEKLSQRNYLAGRVNIQNLLDAQTAMLDNRKALLTLQADNTQAIITLYKAIGGSW